MVGLFDEAACWVYRPVCRSVCVPLFVRLSGRVLITRCWYGNLSVVVSSSVGRSAARPHVAARPGPGPGPAGRLVAMAASYCDVSPLLRPSVRLSVRLSLSLSCSVCLPVCVYVVVVAAIDLTHYCRGGGGGCCCCWHASASTVEIVQ